MLKISTEYKPGQQVWFIINGEVKYNFIWKINIEVTKSSNDYDDDYYRDAVSVKTVYLFRNYRQMSEKELYASKEEAYEHLAKQHGL